jgi:hypothetical protein
MALSLSALLGGAAQAGPVTSLADSLPGARGRQVQLDFNPSKYISATATPSSFAFYLPARWRLDKRAVAKECTAAQAAAVDCPRKSWIGFGHAVTHIAGYLCPGGGTDGVAYVNAYLGKATQPGEQASMVFEVDFLSLDPIIDYLNKYLHTTIKHKDSVIGQITRVTSGSYGEEVSFNGLPGGLTVPNIAGCSGLSSKVTLVKVLIGVVRRVRKNIVRVITVQGLNGPEQESIHDHVLVGYHLWDRPVTCPRSRRWPWKLTVGFSQGDQNVSGTVPCGSLHYGI